MVARVSQPQTQRRKTAAFTTASARIALVDIHAHVPHMGKSASHWLLDGLFIVLSVGLAFGVGQCREARDNRELAARALRSLGDELEFNQKAVAAYVDMHKAWAHALQISVDTSEWKTAVEAYVGTRPPFPSGTQAEFPIEVRRGAW